jgi:hypothetical protein
MGGCKMIIKSSIEEGKLAKVGVRIITDSGRGTIKAIKKCNYQIEGDIWQGCKKCPGKITIKYDRGREATDCCLGLAGHNDTIGFRFKIISKNYLEKWEDAK